ncbi:hypothetical protein B7494_g96 [Chlorociboria aeruginascens]|nr:hypothetical protein B7494_g96 [Chlorociboria aeruginascens]
MKHNHPSTIESIAIGMVPLPGDVVYRGEVPRLDQIIDLREKVENYMSEDESIKGTKAQPERRRAQLLDVRAQTQQFCDMVEAENRKAKESKEACNVQLRRWAWMSVHYEKVTKNDMARHSEVAGELEASLEHWDSNKAKVDKFAKNLESRIRNRGKPVCSLPMAQALGIAREDYQSLNKRFQAFRTEYVNAYTNSVEALPETMAQTTLSAETRRIIQSTLTGSHIDELVEFYAPFNKIDHIRYANHIRSLGDAKRADLLDEYANIWGVNENALKNTLGHIKTFLEDLDSKFHGIDIIDALQRIAVSLLTVVDNHRALAKYCGAGALDSEEDQEIIHAQRLPRFSSRH